MVNFLLSQILLRLVVVDLLHIQVLDVGGAGAETGEIFYFNGSFGPERISLMDPLDKNIGRYSTEIIKRVLNLRLGPMG